LKPQGRSARAVVARREKRAVVRTLETSIVVGFVEVLNSKLMAGIGM
jgi:hypothetical protein